MSAREPLRLRRGADGGLLLEKRGEDGGVVEVAVQLALCFPWSLPQRFLSLRNADGREEALIDDYRSLPEDVRELIEAGLRKRYFVARLTRVLDIREEADLFRWQVATDAGERSFLTSRTDRPRRLAGGEFVVRDVSRDVYVIPDPAQLDESSRAKLWLYLD
jgi:hypothetical protein